MAVVPGGEGARRVREEETTCIVLPSKWNNARQGEEESRVAQEPVCEVEKPAPERDRTKSGKSPQQILNPVRGKFHKENFFKIKLRKVL